MFCQMTLRLGRRKMIEKQFSTTMKRRVPAKNAVTRPMTSRMPALFLRLSDDGFDQFMDTNR